jgi:hypothetical protein
MSKLVPVSHCIYINFLLYLLFRPELNPDVIEQGLKEQSLIKLEMMILSRVRYFALAVFVRRLAVLRSIWLEIT